MNRKAFHQTLPQKRMSAGALFFNEQGELLIVNPTYKETWEIPGGMVEVDESPREACVREIQEELGLRRSVTRLLCLDYMRTTETQLEGLHFIFEGGVLSRQEIDQMQLPPDELSTYAFERPQAALALLNERLRRRVKQCLEHWGSERTLYLEDQQLVFLDER